MTATDDLPVADQAIVAPIEEKNPSVTPAVTVPRTGYQACLVTGIGLVMISE
jgi:hypothetical protein